MHRRLVRLSVLVFFLATPFAVRGAASPPGAQDPTPAGHPLVGAWVLDLDVQSTDDPPLYLLFHTDGTWILANPYFGDGVGAWRPTGARTADATVVFQDLNSDPTQVEPGRLTASFAIEVDATGDAFAARWSSEGRWLDGTLASRDDATGRATRLGVEPLPASGTPVASGPSESPTQPARPATGPGSDDTAFPAARSIKYGPEPGDFWLWEPLAGSAGGSAVAPGPFPVVLYLSGCCGNGDYPTPQEVAPWLAHLARQGYVVIAPVYRAGTILADIPMRLREALAELTRPGHASIDTARFAVVGYSYGGVPAVVYTATAESEGLPIPRALFLVAPCVGSPTCQDVPTDAALPPGLKAVVLAFGEDFRVGIDMPRQVWSTLASLPAADRDFVVMASDGHGQPPLVAHHGAPSDGVDAADRYGIWKLSDALFACAFEGKWCEYALGNTAEQRFMGVWSDGVPVVELQVTDGTTSAP
jgi:acetyl esterase/lipase